MTTFFTSDHHFGHENILKFQSNTRRYSSIHEMNKEYTNKWNSQANEKDIIYHLGDLTFGDPIPYLKYLNGQIKIIPGNHDKWSKKNKFKELYSKHGKIEILPLISVLKLDHIKQIIVLCHYPMYSWAHSFHGSWHLYGHCHKSVNPQFFTMHVGVDDWNGNLVSLDQVVNYMKRYEGRKIGV